MMTGERLERFLSFAKENGFDITDETSSQRKAVLDDACSVLPAGAGSGKTTVLTYRFLRLIMDDELDIHSDEILTITFTKAATANMRAKIYMILKKAESAGLISHEEIRRFTNAEISTTDSFCSRIVRQDSVRYGITSSFMIEDDSDLEEFVEETLRNIVEEKIGKEAECGRLLSLISFEDLVPLFITLTHEYINIASPFTGDSRDLGGSLKKETEEIIKAGNKKKKDELIVLLDAFISKYGKYGSVIEDTTHAEAVKNYLQDGMEINSSFSRKRSVKENIVLNDEFVEERKEIRELFKTLSAFMEYERSDSFSLLDGYASLFTEFERRIIRHKRTEGLLTFHDVILLSIDILKTNRSLREYYNSRFKRIMVDEFQDNNEENKRLLYLLAAKPEFTSTSSYPLVGDILMDKVFMVGDEKQSIYKFRGADVSVFKNISRDFGDGRVLNLTENFRSEKALIEKINEIFNKRIMPEKSPSNPSFEAEYTPLTSRRERVEANISFRYMNASEYPDDDNASNSECEAYEVARIIREEILGKERERYMVYDSREGFPRYPVYDDIAILLRKTSHQSDFEKALRLFDIPFNVTDNKSLTSDAVVNDFYSLLQYSVYKDDDILSFASILRSPFINMSDEDIETIIGNIRNNEKRETGVTEDGRERLIVLDNLLKELEEIEETGKLTGIIHYLWYDTGYRYFIDTDEKNVSYSEHYDYLFRIASDFDREQRGLVEFLSSLRPSLGKVSDFKDLNVLREKKTGVTIQTIHKSKGLEYPIVFVCDMAGKNNGERYSIITLPSGLPLPPYFVTPDNRLKNPLSSLLGVEDNMMENAETKRVLYVAATRSEHHLIFTSVFGKQAVNTEGLVRTDEEKYNSMLQYFVDGIDFGLESGSRTIETRKFEPVKFYAFRDRRTRKRMNKEIESWYFDPEPLHDGGRRVRIGVTTLIGEDEEVKRNTSTLLPSVPADRILIKRKDNDGITEFGTLVHYLIESGINGTVPDTGSYFSDEKERDIVLESALELSNNFLSSEFFMNIRKNSKLYPERKFLMKDGDNLVEGIMDLLSIDGERAIIVDYKTDLFRNEERHRRQLGYYRNALRSIYPGLKVETYVFYLRSAEAVPLEWD